MFLLLWGIGAGGTTGGLGLTFLGRAFQESSFPLIFFAYLLNSHLTVI